MLSPRKHTHNRPSPTKQNISPSHTHIQKGLKNQNHKSLSSQNQTPQLLLAAIHELQCIVVKLGGRVPQHLNYGFNCGGSGLELIPIQQTPINRPEILGQQTITLLTKQLKSTKLALSNLTFQHKKLEQDTAQHKLLTKLQHDKEIKKLKEEISRLEGLNKFDNDEWEGKVEEMRELERRRSQEEVKGVRDELEGKLEQMERSGKERIEGLTKKYQSQIKNIIEKYENRLVELQNELQAKITLTNQTNQQQKQTLRQRTIQTVQKLQKKHQQTISSYTTQSKTQAKTQEEQTITFNKLKQKLYNDLYLVRKEKEELGKIIVELKAEILQGVKDKNLLKEQMKEIENKYREAEDKEKLRKVYEIEKVKAQYRMQLKQVSKQHSTVLEKYQNSLQTLQSLKSQKQSLLHQSHQQLSQKFQDRPPRPQDTTTIQKLSHQLLHKEQQLTSIKQQLKQIKMERENNQKNYTKIFSTNSTGCCNSGRDKERGVTERILERPMTGYSKDRDRAYRTTMHTIDMNFLLKVCNKNF